MIVTVRIKRKGGGVHPLEGKLELKGPFHTGNVITLITGIAGKILQASSRDFIEVEVEPSDYTKMKEEQKWADAF